MTQYLPVPLFTNCSLGQKCCRKGGVHHELTKLLIFGHPGGLGCILWPAPGLLSCPVTGAFRPFVGSWCRNPDISIFVFTLYWTNIINIRCWSRMQRAVERNNAEYTYVSFIFHNLNTTRKPPEALSACLLLGATPGLDDRNIPRNSFLNQDRELRA